MLYTCVKTEVGEIKGQQYAAFWFKLNPDNKFEIPVKLTQLGKHAADSVVGGSFNRYVDIENVEYPLQQPMKYPNGKVVNKLSLVCVKVPMYEEEHDENSIKTGHFIYVGSTWARGYSPEEVAARHLHVLTPVEEQ